MLDEGILYEGGLSRVSQHMNRPFATLSAFRNNYSLKQNRDRNRQMESDLHSFKIGFYKLVGHWQEAPDGMDWKEAVKAGKTEDVIEESFFAPMPKDMEYPEFEKAIQKIARKYDQDAVCISDGKVVSLMFSNGGKDSLGSPTFNKIAQAYSTLRKRPRIPFVFEGTMQPSNNFHSLACQRRGVMWFNVKPGELVENVGPYLVEKGGPIGFLRDNGIYAHYSGEILFVDKKDAARTKDLLMQHKKHLGLTEIPKIMTEGTGALNTVKQDGTSKYVVYNSAGVKIADAFFRRSQHHKYGPQIRASVIYADGRREETGHSYFKDFKRFLETMEVE